MPTNSRLPAQFGLFLIVFAGCASQDQVERLYQSDSIATPFEQILIVGVYSDADARRDFETAFVRALRETGTAARYSLEFIDSTDTVDRDALVNIVTGTGIDAVLISRPVSIDRRGEVEGGRTTATVERRHDIPMADFFRYEYVEYEDPLRLEQVATVVLETDLYRVSDEARVWRARSTAIDKTSVFELVTAEARALTEALEKDGLIR